MTETGDDDGTVDGGGTTQPRTASNIRAERRVLDRLRAALPPPVTIDSLDFPETGGSTLMGEGWEAYYNEPLVQLASTTETGNDDDSATDGGTTQGTIGGPLTLTAAAEATGGATGIPDMPRMCANHERGGHAQAITMCANPAYCCDECAYTNGQEHAEHCYADQITESHAPGSAEMELVPNDTTPAEMRF